MRKAAVVGLAYLAGWMLAACAGASGAAGTDAAPIETAADPGKGREISGAEALKLFGIDVNATPTAVPATATAQIWFPASAWVEPSVLPYDANETINFLPMFSGPTLDVEGTWLGDLAAGSEVILHAVSEDGRACLVEGPMLQGWTTKGWVACNRLRLVASR